jgi:hypothetical protein
MKQFNPLKDLPEEPWEEQSYYIVNISMRKGNPWHKSILYTGFLSNKKPGGYSGLINPSYEPQFLPLNYDNGMLITVERKLGKLL